MQRCDLAAAENVKESVRVKHADYVMRQGIPYSKLSTRIDSLWEHRVPPSQRPKC